MFKHKNKNPTEVAQNAIISQPMKHWEFQDIPNLSSSTEIVLEHCIAGSAEPHDQ